MATKKPKGLGRGLEALLGPTVSETPAPSADGQPHELALSELVAGTYQPRTRLDPKQPDLIDWLDNSLDHHYDQSHD
jgi:hypothetical protein